MNRNLILALAVGAGVVGAVLLFPKGDLDIEVAEVEVEAAQPGEQIVHVDDGGPSSGSGASADATERGDDGSYRDGDDGEPQRVMNPAAREANARLKAPFPQWSNKARPTWKAIDYTLRKAGDSETGAIALEVYDALMAVRRETDPDIQPLLALQEDALNRLRASPNAGEIEDLLDKAEGLMEELKTLPPSEFAEADAR